LQRIQYAKTESDAVAKLKGTYKPDKKKRQEKAAAARGILVFTRHAETLALLPTHHQHLLLCCLALQTSSLAKHPSLVQACVQQ
jgi:hypothetical protein